jgi:hypothetical protein
MRSIPGQGRQRLLQQVRSAPCVCYLVVLYAQYSRLRRCSQIESVAGCSSYRLKADPSGHRRWPPLFLFLRMHRTRVKSIRTEHAPYSTHVSVEKLSGRGTDFHFPCIRMPCRRWVRAGPTLAQPLLLICLCAGCHCRCQRKKSWRTRIKIVLERVIWMPSIEEVAGASCSSPQWGITAMPMAVETSIAISPQRTNMIGFDRKGTIGIASAPTGRF